MIHGGGFLFYDCKNLSDFDVERCDVQEIFQLDCGEELTLFELKQEISHFGWLEGYPRVKWNQRHIDGMMEALSQACPKQSKPFLIRPESGLTDMPQTDPDDRFYKRWGAKASFPKVTCVGRFYNTIPVKYSDLDYSQLTIIWFQNEYAFPVDEKIRRTIAGLDWKELATDFEI